MNRKIIVILLLLCGVLLYGLYIVWEHIRTVRTEGRLSRISLAIGKTLSKKKWDIGYSPVQEIKKLFPEMQTKNNQFIDGWGNEIRINIQAEKDTFLIRIRSAGKDNIFGTEDDQYRQGSLAIPQSEK